MDQAVSQVTAATVYDKRRKIKPWDCALMDLLISSNQPNAFLLIVGENHGDEIQKHAFYYAAKLRKRCWFLCLESTPMISMLSMLSFATGIPRHYLLDLRIPPRYFDALNHGLEELYKADCKFSFAPLLDLASLVSRAKLLRRKDGVEVLLIDALQRVEFEPGKASTPTEQRWVSQAIRAVAHAGELTVVAGFYRPGDEFPDLASDSAFYCESSKDKENTKQGRIKHLIVSTTARTTSFWRRTRQKMTSPA